MWEQPTEPTLVGAPIGHPDGSFSMTSSASSGQQGGNVGGGPVSLWGQTSGGSAPRQPPQSNTGNNGWGMAAQNVRPPAAAGQWGQPATPVKNGPTAGSSSNGWDMPVGPPGGGQSNANTNAGGWTNAATNQQQQQQQNQPMWIGGANAQNSQVYLIVLPIYYSQSSERKLLKSRFPEVLGTVSLHG